MSTGALNILTASYKNQLAAKDAEIERLFRENGLLAEGIRLTNALDKLKLLELQVGMTDELEFLRREVKDISQREQKTTAKLKKRVRGANKAVDKWRRKWAKERRLRMFAEKAAEVSRDTARPSPHEVWRKFIGGKPMQNEVERRQQMLDKMYPNHHLKDDEVVQLGLPKVPHFADKEAQAILRSQLKADRKSAALRQIQELVKRVEEYYQ